MPVFLSQTSCKFSSYRYKYLRASLWDITGAGNMFVSFGKSFMFLDTRLIRYVGGKVICSVSVRNKESWFKVKSDWMTSHPGTATHGRLFRRRLLAYLTILTIATFVLHLISSPLSAVDATSRDEQEKNFDLSQWRTGVHHTWHFLSLWLGYRILRRNRWRVKRSGSCRTKKWRKQSVQWSAYTKRSRRRRMSSLFLSAMRDNSATALAGNWTACFRPQCGHSEDAVQKILDTSVQERDLARSEIYWTEVSGYAGRRGRCKQERSDSRLRPAARTWHVPEPPT